MDSDFTGMSLKELRTMAEGLSAEKLREFSAALKDDPRQGVQKYASSLERKMLSLERERARIDAMRETERQLIRQGISPIAGVDEAGRGPLCGPVVSCTLILPEDFDQMWINDSKKLSEKKREELYGIITQNAVAFEVGDRKSVV